MPKHCRPCRTLIGNHKERVYGTSKSNFYAISLIFPGVTDADILSGSPVAVDKVSLRCPPLLSSLRYANTPRPTSSSGKLLNASSSQPPAVSSSRAPSYRTSPAQPSFASCVEPPADRPQALPNGERLLHAVTESQARQATPFQSPQIPGPTIFHQGRCDPLLQPIARQPQASDSLLIGRDPRSCVGGRETIQAARVCLCIFCSKFLYGPSGIGTYAPQDAEIYHQPTLSEAPARPVVFRNPLAALDSAKAHRPPVIPPVYLTSDACSRLKDHTDDAVLATIPVVRVLVLRSIGSPNSVSAIKSYEAFVTDGHEYMWLAFAASASRSFGDRDDCRSVQVGSAVRLNTMSRFSGDAFWYLYFAMLCVYGGNSALNPAQYSSTMSMWSMSPMSDHRWPSTAIHRMRRSCRKCLARRKLGRQSRLSQSMALLQASMSICFFMIAKVADLLPISPLSLWHLGPH